MKIVKYKELGWYVIEENEKGKTLFLRDSFTNELVNKYFSKNYIDDCNDVQFNKDCTNPWWRDSYIRQILNTRFIEDLDIEDLNVMETTIELDNEKVTTKDYVRLLTKEEVEKLSINVLKTERQYGYWTMSPCRFISSDARVFFVYSSDGNPGDLNNFYVTGSYAVRPVISLKSSVLTTEVIDSTTGNPDCEVIEEVDRKATNKELADKLNEVIRAYNKSKKEVKDNE